jgi:hypothetical protein
MNAEQVNTVGAWCELVGVAFLVRDLMSLARFREKPKEWAARFRRWAARVRAWWAATPVMAWWRRLRRQHPVTCDLQQAAFSLLGGPLRAHQ